MATITAVVEEVSTKSRVILWETLTETNSDGSSVSYHGDVERSVQVMGTFGGATITIQGSNDGGIIWATLHDAAGANLDFTVAGLELVLENARHMRPIVTGGAGVDVDVHLFTRSVG